MAPDDAPEVTARFHAELDLVKVVARALCRRLGHHVEFDELISAGHEGLLEAARRFEPDNGTPFRAYARFRVEGAMLDSVRRNSRLPRRMHARLTAEKAALSVRESAITARPADLRSPEPTETAIVDELAAIVTAATLAIGHAEPEAQSGGNPELAYERMELFAAVKDAVDDLGPHETELIRRHYFQGQHLEDIAADLGMSKPSASRLHAKALARLSKLLRSER